MPLGWWARPAIESISAAQPVDTKAVARDSRLRVLGRRYQLESAGSRRADSQSPTQTGNHYPDGRRRTSPINLHECQCRNTPQLVVPWSGAEYAADSAIAITVRVSRGSMMPSSQSRAVAKYG